MTHVLVHWEDGVCDGWSTQWVGHGGHAEAAQQAVDHMREVLGDRYPELGNLLSIEVLHEGMDN